MGLAAQAGLLAAVVLVAWLLVAPLAYAFSGSAGVVAAAVGAGVCFVGGGLALSIAGLLNHSSAAMVSLALAMLARTLIPLVLGVALHRAVPLLAGAGMIFYLLVFYMVALATETALMLAKVPPSGVAPGKAL